MINPKSVVNGAFCLLVFLTLSGVAVSAQAAATAQVSCPTRDRCNVTVQTQDGDKESFNLLGDSGSFDSEARIVVSGKELPIKDVKTSERFSTGGSTQNWATAQIAQQDNKSILKSGVFRTSKGVVEFKTQSGDLVSGDVDLTQVKDIAIPLPPGTSDYTPPNSSTPLGESDLKPSDNGLIPFFPGCYTMDSRTRTLKLGIAADYGFVQAAAAGASSQEQLVARTLAAIENVVSPARLIYLAQLNIYLSVEKVVMGDANSESPLNQAGDSCSNALGSFSSFIQWKAKNNVSLSTGSWMLLSNCFSGITGVSYIGSMCGSANTAVSQRSWLTFAHELGHSIGSSHSFENGIGTTGGIMDYSDGMYNGVPQFHPNKRTEICPFLTWVSNSSCPHFPIRDEGSCGDGVMDPTEKCECLKVGSKKCGACVDCKLTRRITCSTKQFVMRYPDSKDFVAAVPAELSNPGCCNPRGKLAPPRTLCNNKRDVCATHGECTPVCTRYLMSDTKNCGFDPSGCIQGCIWNNQCHFDFTFPDGSLVSKVPDGTSCFVNKNTRGTCENAVCLP